MRRLLAAVCRRLSHDVVAFDSSSAALDHLTSQVADLLITDIVVTPFDGLSLIERVRIVQPGLEAIAITGFSSQYQVEDAVAAGASDLLFKPFRADELEVRITLADDRQRAIGKLQRQRERLQQTSTLKIRELQDELTALKRLAETRQEGVSAAGSLGDAS